jgi:hypothetical protein
MLNITTDIIAAWEEVPRPAVADVKARFPEHNFT